MIILKSFNNKILDKVCEICIQEAKKNQLNVSFVRLPRAKKKITLIKSPHVHKSSREQFETVSYKRLLLIEGEKKTIEEVINKDITKNRYSFFSQIKWSFKQSY